MASGAPAPSRSGSMRCGWRPSARAERGSDQRREERVGAVRPALELGVCLRADPQWVARQLDHFHQAPIGGLTRTAQARLLEAAPVPWVDLVAVAVALEDKAFPVDRGDVAASEELCRVGPQPHGAAIVGLVHDFSLVVHQVNNEVRCSWGELA